jgi:hypothetical protein
VSTGKEPKGGAGLAAWVKWIRDGARRERGAASGWLHGGADDDGEAGTQVERHARGRPGAEHDSAASTQPEALIPIRARAVREAGSSMARRVRDGRRG